MSQSAMNDLPRCSPAAPIHGNFQSTDRSMETRSAVWNYTSRRALFRACYKMEGGRECEKRASCSHLRIYIMRRGGGLCRSYLSAYLFLGLSKFYLLNGSS
jgi:hypothetical protein